VADVKRQVWKTPKAGAIKRLVLTEESLPALKEGEVLIRAKAVGLNFADIFALTGLYSATPKGAFIPGLEFSGIIEAVAADVDNLKVGHAFWRLRQPHSLGHPILASPATRMEF